MGPTKGCFHFISHVVGGYVLLHIVLVERFCYTFYWWVDFVTHFIGEYVLLHIFWWIDFVTTFLVDIFYYTFYCCVYFETVFDESVCHTPSKTTNWDISSADSI